MSTKTSTPLQERARGLLAAKALLRAERHRQALAHARAQRRSRQRLRRRRAAEQQASDLLRSGQIPATVAASRQQLATLLLESAESALLSRADLADLELTLSHRLKTGGRTRRVRAAYWSLIGDPPHCAPGDVDQARVYHRRIWQAIDCGGWTRSERAALYVLARRWLARANGTDARFALVGTAGPGRLPKALERQLGHTR